MTAGSPFAWPDLSGSRAPDAADVEQIRRRAFDEGLAAGREAGLRQGLEEAAAEIAETRTRLGESLRSLDDYLTATRETDVGELARIVHQVCRAVLQQELVSNDEWWRSLLEELTERLSAGGGPVVIKVHPSDRDWLAGDRFAAIDVVEDETVRPGEIRAECERQLVAVAPFDTLRHITDVS